MKLEEEDIELSSLEELDRMLKEKPGYQEAYDSLELEFVFINEIIKQRIEKGVTQAKLAEKMGTKQSAIARFESGMANPTLDFLKRLAAALGLTLRITVQ